ncbi:V-type ATP synthase subunit E family protein [Clostridium botulinum]|uniref:V-type proton ATPase subunit E n=2 Tax=Clostridium botulinum TaxID=1491 RepID=VATE_CLOB6|nr:V-type ATP synthase subunit E family protein [Clostridium botulinum]C3L1B4.1 RecName: Full=V-type proton ATPase subunit E; AltName: Full=V-ATPase subunit E [Clostridium botulinum Ba4 str. 657]AJD28141.1 ATP synthase (E/31 kDa) subunit [Clostridium botulinum CDC_297]ACQ52891.1 V-type sodium ATPase, E subunit [Clostridium botulinum Ba4 str. 657]AJE09837.1 ATP synthase (E/31 kDa) subunit [Clostridium botulinum CDC_1436]APU61572.1 ATP synthase (E/31 kDa) subunit [Clostridium botulinum]AUN04071
MSNLENLTSKIIEDANKEAEKLLSEAKKEENKIVDEKIKKANKAKEQIIERAKRESRTKAERVISNAHLKVRNNKLEAKQEMINKVFDKAVIKLQNLSKDEYLNFVKSSILSLDIEGDEEIIVSPNDKDKIDISLMLTLNNQLKAKGKKALLKISNENRNIKGGFILYKNGIEINNSFEALVDSLRDELEQEIIEALFS